MGWALVFLTPHDGLAFRSQLQMYIFILAGMFSGLKFLANVDISTNEAINCHRKIIDCNAVDLEFTAARPCTQACRCEAMLFGERDEVFRNGRVPDNTVTPLYLSDDGRLSGRWANCDQIDFSRSPARIIMAMNGG